MKVKLWGLGIIAAMPILSLMVANPSIATTFELTPLDLGNGYSVSGTVATDGTIGYLSTNNFIDWNIAVTSVNEYVVAQANSLGANIFNIVPLDFGERVTRSGTITINSNTPNQFNPIDWNIVVRQVTIDTFNKGNSMVLASDNVSTNGQTITVAKPNGSWAFGIPGIPGRIDPTVVQLADFSGSVLLKGNK